MIYCCHTGVAGYLAFTCWGLYSSGVIPWLTGTLIALSAAMALFALYNVAAGGNPPKKRT